MSDIFDPNIPSQDYAKALRDHYKKINAKYSVTSLKNQKKYHGTKLEDIELKPRYRPIDIVALPPPQTLQTMTADEKYRITSGQCSILDEHGGRMAPALMLRKICRAYNAVYADILSEKRDAQIVRIRANMIQTLYVLYPHLTLPQMGKLFHRDHTTILNMIKKFSIDPEAKVKNFSNIKLRRVKGS